MDRNRIKKQKKDKTVENIKKTKGGNNDQNHFKSGMRSTDGYIHKNTNMNTLIEPVLSGDEPIFMIISPINGGGSLRAIPLKFYSDKGETVIVIDLMIGSIKKGDRVRLIDEMNLMHFSISFISKIKINGSPVNSLSPIESKGKLVEICILNKEGKVFDHNQLIKFNNFCSREL